MAELPGCTHLIKYCEHLRADASKRHIGGRTHGKTQKDAAEPNQKWENRSGLWTLAENPVKARRWAFAGKDRISLL